MLKFPGLIITLLMLFAAPAWSADDVDAWLAQTTRQVNQIEKKLGLVSLDQADVDSDVKTLAQVQGRSQKCVDEGNTALAEAQKNLDALGEPVAGEPPEVSKKRRELKKQLNRLKNRINACQLLLIQSGEVAQRLKQRISKEVASRLFHRGPGLADVAAGVMAHPADKPWWDVARFRDEESAAKLSGSDLRSLWLLAGFALLAGLIWRRVLLRRFPAHDGALDVYDGFLLALRACVSQYLPLLAPLLAVSLALLAMLRRYDAGIVSQFFLSATAAMTFYLLIRAVLSPCRPATTYMVDSPKLAGALSRRLSTALFIIWLSYMLLATPLRDLIDADLMNLARAALLTALVLLLANVLWRMRRFSWAVLPGWLRLVIMLVLVLALLAEYLGYRNFSVFLMLGTVGSLSSLAVAIVTGRFSADLFDQIDNGTQLWQVRVRNALGVKSGERVPGLLWLRLLVVLSIWGGFVFAVLRAWGLSRQSELALFEALSQGFDLGSFHVVPSRILLALLIFSLVLGLSRLVKKKIAEPWVKHTRLDRGARDAVVTIIGYVGFILAAIVSLSVAGLDFKNLAVIAGALSVGIGFGLQNIVNNFVSGLILLFERPIRAGDWIQVGGTEGHVKSINIRSTEIQTFDRADVIVPNSELISGQVTNWQLHDPTGRVRVPIGVAYGTDAEQVRDILLKIAAEHPDAITDSRYVKPPKVLFREFGDSSLNFELRFFIRDIDRRLTVISEINFAIDKAFREAGIEIPFPQRDVHIKKG